ncbi:MAG TPA: 5-formyltetrahydrofolate cyclo-ligase [Flavitalea sp.]|nr:5-formyltetrahydrofolate cyclo-ligase [Flavitalea sp.]
MTKQEIRTLYKTKRQQLSVESIDSFSISMLHLFRKINLTGKRHVLSYAPIKGRNEFNVRLCDNVITAQAAGIALPRIDPVSLSMEAVQFTNSSVVVQNSLGIEEVAGGTVLDAAAVDVVLVPLLAFDPKGYRVGYGKGYYDRYLFRCRPDVLKIGFSFFEPVESIEDISLFDVPLNYSITPMRLYEF